MLQKSERGNNRISRKERQKSLRLSGVKSFRSVADLVLAEGYEAQVY